MAEATNGGETQQAAAAAAAVGAVHPYLCVEAPKAQEAIDWYVAALGFKVAAKMHAPKRKAEQEQPLVLHAHLTLGPFALMLADHNAAGEETEQVTKPPPQLNGTTFYLNVMCDDPDAIVAKAVQHGAKVTLPLQDFFWGRFAKFVDPFGFEWGVMRPASGGEGAEGADGEGEKVDEVMEEKQEEEDREKDKDTEEKAGEEKKVEETAEEENVVEEKVEEEKVEEEKVEEEKVEKEKVEEEKVEEEKVEEEKVEEEKVEEEKVEEEKVVEVEEAEEKTE